MLISVFIPLTTGAAFFLSGASSVERDFRFIITEDKMTHWNEYKVSCHYLSVLELL